MNKPRDIWFVEERVLDHWAPALYHGERPSQKRTDTSRKFRAEPKKVDDRHRELSLDILAELYGVREGA